MEVRTMQSPVSLAQPRAPKVACQNLVTQEGSRSELGAMAASCCLRLVALLSSGASKLQSRRLVPS